jgi:hypothetical protein
MENHWPRIAKGPRNRPGFPDVSSNIHLQTRRSELTCPAYHHHHGRDGNGDGAADPLNIDDAALSAAVYLCSGGRNLGAGQDWTDAVLSYNHSADYVSQVRGQANAYAALAGAGG